MTLVNYLNKIPDPRRGQAKQYDLGSLLLFCIMLILSGSTSYRKIQRFMHAHREHLNQLYNISWKRAPAHNTIRYALHLLEAKEVEKAFRHHASKLQAETASYGSIAMDGKVIRGSFDHFEDRKAAQVLSALTTGRELVLRHIWITDDDGDKEHEIQAVQHLVKELGIVEQLFTLDALHTQKGSALLHVVCFKMQEEFRTKKEKAYAVLFQNPMSLLPKRPKSKSRICGYRQTTLLLQE